MAFGINLSSVNPNPADSFSTLAPVLGMPEDPRARGYGYDSRRYYEQGGTAIQNAEALGVNALNEGRRFDQATDSISRDADQRDLKGRLADARSDADAFSTSNEGRFERATRGMGLSERKQRGAKSRLSLNRAVSVASAMGSARRNSAQTARDAQQASGGLANILLGQEAAVASGLANAEGQRIVRKAQEKAADRADRNSWISTGIGAVLSIAALASSEEWKDKVEESPDLLSKLKKVRVDKWKYKGDKDDHVGPYAEEFNDTFGTKGAKGDTRYINLIDAIGVALGSIKQLDKKVEAMAGV